jgi:hypothetical protein
MECYDEDTLESAAGAYLRAGIDLGAEGARAGARPGGEISPELRSILSHARSCTRCRELLEIFQSTERELRANLTGASRGAPPLCIPLEPLAARVTDRPGVRDPAWTGYALAADSERPAQTADSRTSPPVLTMASADGRFLVRIFRRSAGEGATAILVRGDQLPAGAPLPEGASEVCLLFQGTEYHFDEKGHVALPRFPADEISLLVR